MEEVRENFQLVHCLKHPNIASTDFLDRDEYGTYFLIMELASGENLSQWIKRKWKNGRPDIEEILEIVRQVAAALDYAHDKHILHRDIKPANVMVDEDGKVKVLDLGLASKVRSSMTALSIGPMHSSGTPNYLSPEQFQGRYPSPASDQYALGVMTYQMLAGHLPFESDDFNVLRSAVVSNPPEAIVDIPESMACALQKILNKDPQTRFGSCSEFADVLSGRKHKSLSVLLESKTLKSPIKTLQQFIAKRSNLLILAIFVVIIGSMFYLGQKRQEQLLQTQIEQISTADDTSGIAKGKRILTEFEKQIARDKARGIEFSNGDQILVKAHRSIAGDYKIPKGIIEIMPGAFKGCGELKRVDIPNSVTYIGEEAFADCSSLENVKIPKGVTKIMPRTFKRCGKLKSVDIPNSVTNIGEEAFSYCSSLENINIPNSVTKIAESSFVGCSSLKNINIPK